MQNSALFDYGFIYQVCGGFQFDLNSVLKKTNQGYIERHHCDHNCTTDCGNYQCPAAFSSNRDIDQQTTLSLDEIEKSLQNAYEGMVLANKQFLKNIFSQYCHDYYIPKHVAKDLIETLSTSKLELNMFGGNPELHPQFLEIIKIAHRIGWKVTTTTTGKKFMYDEQFTKAFLKHPPDLLAISADDYEDLNELKQLLDLNLEELKQYWQKINPLYGQRKKAFESIYSAKLALSNKKFPKMLFNIVVHPGNIDVIYEMIKLLSVKFPSVLINPYPAQSSFSFSSLAWKIEHLPKIEKFVDFMIDKQFSRIKNNFPAVARLLYWLALKSIFETKLRDTDKLAMLSGYDIWKCYKQAGAGRYLQASLADKRSKKPFRVGAHPGCFWNHETVTDNKHQLWNMTPEEISLYLLDHKTKLPAKSENPCPGCIMPRLMFDGISIELGLDHRLLPAYLKLRNKYFNF